MINEWADGSDGESGESSGLQTCVVHYNGHSYMWLVAATVGSMEEGTSLPLQSSVGQHCFRPFV